MSFIVFVALVAYASYRGRLFLSKAWLAFGEPFARKMGRRAEAVVVEANANARNETPLSATQAAEMRK